MQQRGGRRGRWSAAVRPAITALAAAGLLAACGSTPQPSPLAVSPAATSPSATASATPTATPSQTAITTVTPTAPSPSTTATVVVSPVVIPTRSTGPVLRRTYPGITRLVIVKSYLNRTRAGIAALNTIAAYTSILATATSDGSIRPARLLAARSCTECQSDLDRIDSYIAQKQQIVGIDGRFSPWTSVALYISSISEGGVVSIDFDGVEAAVQLRSSTGKILVRQGGDLVSDTQDVQVGTRSLIIATRSR